MNYFKILIALLTLGLFSCQGQKTAKIELLDAKTFSTQISSKANIQLLDVRTPAEYEDQHIDKATNIDILNADFEKKIAVLDKSKPLYVYCKSGKRSAKATSKLVEMGFKEIYELDGGIMNWNASGMAKPTVNTKGLSKEDFNKLLISDKKVLFNFYDTNCEQCEKMAPYLDKMNTEMADKISIIRIDGKKNKELIEQLNIEMFPTLMLYENKALKWKNAGFISEEDLIKKL